MVEIVATAKIVRIPITTTTTTVCALATACDPTTLSPAITTTTATANTLPQVSSPSVTALLA